MRNDDVTTVFAHAKNITVGKGRVLWAPATTDTSGLEHEAGWVLPGGIRTQDLVAAHAAAMSLHDLIGAA